MAMRSARVLGLLLALLLGACSNGKRANDAAAPAPEVLEQLYQEGRIAYAAGRFNEAADKFASVVYYDPQHLNALINWGVALARSGKPVEAVGKYQQALALDPYSAEAYYNWGVALERLGNDREAVDKYDKALALKAQLLTPELERYLQRQRARQQESQIKSVPAKPATPPR
jgi:tetratricopeptide (TPR) repeat protein